jgi:hypothetical protein
MLEQKRTSELLSDFEDYDVDGSGTRGAGRRRREQ